MHEYQSSKVGDLLEKSDNDVDNRASTTFVGHPQLWPML